ncbi:hypothetical protein V6N13_122631 [Hibiscus sabdariffa]|uniref:Uncharacterized protein n=2 Tax=Hibiscus sabdariffa TaxID=183260 RepID=A0ABR2P4L9_9ROSI
MQRQSLGSPTSKLRIHGGEESSVSVDQKRQLIIDDDDGKDSKPRRLSFSPASSSLTSPPKPEKLIHLIPVLTLLCLLILYLNSHNPSQSDSTEIGGNGIIESGRGDILGIRSLKNLQEVDRNVTRYRPHRKIADF